MPLRFWQLHWTILLVSSIPTHRAQCCTIWTWSIKPIPSTRPPYNAIYILHASKTILDNPSQAQYPGLSPHRTSEFSFPCSEPIYQQGMTFSQLARHRGQSDSETSRQTLHTLPLQLSSVHVLHTDIGANSRERLLQQSRNH